MIKACLLIQSPNLKLLSLYVAYINIVLKKLNLTYTSRFNPTKQKRLTLLKSPHVYKKHKEQFLIKKFSISFSLSLLRINRSQFILLLKNKPKFVDLSFKLER